MDAQDWRLTGQDKYLKGAKLILDQYRIFSKKWDHDHCSFCMKKFSTLPQDLHEGYRTADSTYWVCEDCFEDFKIQFNWTT